MEISLATVKNIQRILTYMFDMEEDQYITEQYLNVDDAIADWRNRACDSSRFHDTIIREMLELNENIGAKPAEEIITECFE